MLKKRHVSRHAAPSTGRRFGAAEAYGWGGVTLAGVIGAIRSGFSGAAMMLGFYMLVVGVIAMARGRVGWARLGSHAAGGVALGASMIIMTVGALTPPPTTSALVTTVTPASPASSTTSVDGFVSTATPTPEPVATATAQGSSSPPTVAAPPVAQPAPAPATVAPGKGPTALCNDGTLSFKAHNRGTCASHGGVKVFYK
ncbi:MAG: DUF3761 domain-containing protein [Phycicoccus sp.]|nr:DUF3761 domain-containing protein [Phycicoccus sp.]NMM35228.1 DUF3761 domain-containing protein [Phycicoccus sp.]